LLYYYLDGWARDSRSKEESHWEVGDKVDVYIESVNIKTTN
jgi:hypothetical protein